MTQQNRMSIEEFEKHLIVQFGEEHFKRGGEIWNNEENRVFLLWLMDETVGLESAPIDNEVACNSNLGNTFFMWFVDYIRTADKVYKDALVKGDIGEGNVKVLPSASTVRLANHQIVWQIMDEYYRLQDSLDNRGKRAAERLFQEPMYRSWISDLISKFSCSTLMSYDGAIQYRVRIWNVYKRLMEGVTFTPV